MSTPRVIPFDLSRPIRASDARQMLSAINDERTRAMCRWWAWYVGHWGVEPVDVGLFKQTTEAWLLNEQSYILKLLCDHRCGFHDGVCKACEIAEIYTAPDRVEWREQYDPTPRIAMKRWNATRMQTRAVR